MKSVIFPLLTQRQDDRKKVRSSSSGSSSSSSRRNTLLFNRIYCASNSIIVAEQWDIGKGAMCQGI